MPTKREKRERRVGKRRTTWREAAGEGQRHSVVDEETKKSRSNISSRRPVKNSDALLEPCGLVPTPNMPCENDESVTCGGNYKENVYSH